jgi:hypothetical protein
VVWESIRLGSRPLIRDWANLSLAVRKHRARNVDFLDGGGILGPSESIEGGQRAGSRATSPGSSTRTGRGLLSFIYHCSFPAIEFERRFSVPLLAALEGEPGSDPLLGSHGACRGLLRSGPRHLHAVRRRPSAGSAPEETNISFPAWVMALPSNRNGSDRATETGQTL